MRRGMKSILVLCALATAPVSASAETGDGEVIRLSPDEQEQAIEAGIARRTLEAETNKPDRKIHGEFGFMVGTGGARGLYGTAEVPLGEDASAVISFSHEEGRHLRPYGYHDRFGRNPLYGPVFPY